MSEKELKELRKGIDLVLEEEKKKKENDKKNDEKHK